MRRLLPLVLLVSCTARGPVTVQHGESTISIGANGAVGAKTYQRIAVNKNGTLSITTRDDSEAVAARAVDAAMMIGGGMISAGVQKSKDAADAAVAIGAQKQATAAAKIAADAAVSLGAQGVETTRILTPP